METGWLRKKSVKPTTNKITKYFGQKPKLHPKENESTIGSSQTQHSPANKLVDISNVYDTKLCKLWIDEENDKPNDSMFSTWNKKKSKENVVSDVRYENKIILQNNDDLMIKLCSQPLVDTEKPVFRSTCMSQTEIQLPCNKTDEFNIQEEACNLKINSSPMHNKNLTVLPTTTTDVYDNNCTFNLSLNSQSCFQQIPFLPVDLDMDLTLCGQQFLENNQPEMGEDKELGVSCCDVKSYRKIAESVQENSELQKPEASEEPSTQSPPHQGFSELSATSVDICESNCTFSLSLNSQTCIRHVPLVPLNLDSNFTLSSQTFSDNEISELREYRGLGVNCCNLNSLKRKSLESVYEIPKLQKTEGSEVQVTHCLALQSDWDDSLKLDSEGPIVPIKCRELCMDFTLTL